MIRSSSNQHIAQVRKLGTSSKYRRESGLFICEGIKLVDAAIDSGADILKIMCSSDMFEGLMADRLLPDIEMLAVDPPTLERALPSASSQPIVAVVAKPDPTPFDTLLDAEAQRGRRSVLVLIDVSDPGNTGTLIRTAVAAGVGIVVVAGSSCDVYNPKCVRSTAGTIFAAKLAHEPDPIGVCDRLKRFSRTVVGTVVSSDSESIFDADIKDGALLLGSEAHGLPPKVLAQCDRLVHIPMSGDAESLSVASAGAIGAYAIAPAE